MEAFLLLPLLLLGGLLLDVATYDDGAGPVPGPQDEAEHGKQEGGDGSDPVNGHEDPSHGDAGNDVMSGDEGRDAFDPGDHDHSAGLAMPQVPDDPAPDAPPDQAEGGAGAGFNADGPGHDRHSGGDTLAGGTGEDDDPDPAATDVPAPEIVQGFDPATESLHVEPLPDHDATTALFRAAGADTEVVVNGQVVAVLHGVRACDIAAGSITLGLPGADPVVVPRG